MKKKNDLKLIKFPTNTVQLERQVEAILFAAEEPLDLQSIQDKLKTRTDIKKILDSVRSGVESGSVSVKDVEKSKQSINDIQDLLPQLITQKAEFTQKKDKLNESLTIFDNDILVTLTHNLEKSRFNISDRESKISIIRQQIDSSKSSVHDMISKPELNLKQASSISYKISYTENDF